MFDVNSDGQIRTDKMASSCWSVPGSDKKFSSICRPGASGLWTFKLSEKIVEVRLVQNLAHNNFLKGFMFGGLPAGRSGSLAYRCHMDKNDPQKNGGFLRAGFREILGSYMILCHMTDLVASRRRGRRGGDNFPMCPPRRWVYKVIHLLHGVIALHGVFKPTS